MVVGRGGDLDLPRSHRIAIDLDHARREGHAPVQEGTLLLLRESPALLEERPDGLLVPVLRIHPDEMEPGLEIPDLLGSQRLLARQARPSDHRGRARPELAVAGIGLEHPRGVHAEEMAREKPLLLRGELLGARSRQIEKRVRLPRSDRLELIQEHGGQIERRVDARVAPEHRHHVAVILRGVEAGPRKEDPSRERVAIGRLVHVPHQREQDGIRHDGGGSRGSGSKPGVGSRPDPGSKRRAPRFPRPRC